MAFRLQAILSLKDDTGKGVKSAERGFEGLGKAVKTVGIAMAGAFAADKILDIAKLGAQAERTEQRFTMLAGGADQAAKMLQAFQDGAGGAASKMEAMASSSKLMQMGLVDSADAMEKTIEMATRLGDQTMDVGSRVADWAAMLANQSIPRLDNFGISSGKVREKIAELQAAMPGLSRETAFMQAVMEEGGKSLERLGPRVDDNLMAFEKLNATLDDLKVELGQAIVPLVSALAGALTSALEALKPFVEWLQQAQAEIKAIKYESDAFEQSIRGGAEGMQEGADVAEEFARRMQVVAKETSGLNDVILWLGNNSSILGNTASRADLLAAAVEGLHEQAIEISGSYKEYTDVIDRYNALIGDAGPKTQALTQAEYELAAGTGVAAHEMRKLEEGYRLATSGAAALEQQIQYTEAELKLMTAATEDSDQAMLNSVAAYESGLIVTDAHQVALRQQYQAAQEAAAGLDEWRIKAAEHTAALAEHRKAVADAAVDYTNLAASMKDATDAQIANALIGMLDPEEMGAAAFTTAVTEIGTMFGIMDEKSIALAENLPKLAEALEEQVIPAENADEALKALVEDAIDGDVNIGALIGKFDKFPESADPATESAGDMALKLEDLVGAGEPTISTMDDLAGSVQKNTGPMSEATQLANELERELTSLAGDYDVNITITTTGSLPSTSGGGGSGGSSGIEMQHGGVVPGRIGQAIPILAHGGEVILNPYQYGAMGGPGGPPPPPNVSYGGDTFINNFFNPQAAAIERERQRQRRMARLSQRL